MCVCVLSACLVPRNLGECFVLLLFLAIAGNNVSPSDEQLWRFLKNVLVGEKSLCQVLSIGRYLEIFSLLLMLTDNNKTQTFVSLGLCFWGFVYCHEELFLSYLRSFVHKFTSSSTNPIMYM